MIFDVGFQIAGAILLVYGLAIRNRKEIIETSARPPFLVYGKVPIIVKEKWNETYLCRFGITLTLVGYVFSIFNFTITENMMIEIISIFVLNIILIVVSIILSDQLADSKFKNTDPEIFEQYAKDNGLIVIFEDD